MIMMIIIIITTTQHSLLSWRNTVFFQIQHCLPPWHNTAFYPGTTLSFVLAQHCLSSRHNTFLFFRENLQLQFAEKSRKKHVFGSKSARIGRDGLRRCMQASFCARNDLGTSSRQETAKKWKIQKYKKQKNNIFFQNLPKFYTSRETPYNPSL